MSGLSRAGGVGRGTGTPQTSDAPTAAELHLGDRLAALVDGELGHDARERVLAHLATCRNCKVEADAQRSLKNVFADTAPPPPSDGLLARLQQLPGGEPGDPAGPADSAASRGRQYGSGVPDFSGPRDAGPRRREKSSTPSGEGLMPAVPFGGPPGLQGLILDHLPGGRGGRSALAPPRGFRIHETERPSASRGRRFAFVAAGAVSLAALALGGAFGTGANGGSTVASGDGGGPSVGQARSVPNGAAADRDGRRRGGGGEPGTKPGGQSAEKPKGSGESGRRSGKQGNGSPGASSRTGPGSTVQRLGPAPTAPRTVQPAISLLRASQVYPLLHDAVSAPPLIRSALSSTAYSPDSGGASNEAVPGRTSLTKALPPASTAPGARSQR